MTSETKQLLREPDIEPTSEVIATGLGQTNKAYLKFIQGSETASRS